MKPPQIIALEPVHQEKIPWFRRRLFQWFSTHRRDFPWRENGVADYHLLMTEILLQRTKAETVKDFYPGFFQKYPDWESLFAAGEAELQDVLKPLGLFRHRASRIRKMMDDWGRRQGKWPENSWEVNDSGLGSLYLANSYALFVLHKKAPLLDVNMSRVLSRFFGLNDNRDIRNNKTIQTLAERVVQTKNCRELNWAVLDFAAIVCKSKKPDCHHCPLAKKCDFNRTAEALPD